MDTVLFYLNNNRDKFFPIKSLLNQLGIPDDKDNLRSIVESLEANKHIDVKDIRYDFPEIKITEAGIEFITRTSYEDSPDNPELLVHGFMSTNMGSFKLNGDHFDDRRSRQNVISPPTREQKIIRDILIGLFVTVVGGIILWLLLK